MVKELTGIGRAAGKVSIDNSFCCSINGVNNNDYVFSI